MIQTKTNEAAAKTVKAHRPMLVIVLLSSKNKIVFIAKWRMEKRKNTNQIKDDAYGSRMKMLKIDNNHTFYWASLCSKNFVERKKKTTKREKSAEIFISGTHVTAN